MRQKKSYKSIKPDAVVREYRLMISLLWFLHILTIPLAAFFIWRGFSGQTTPVNGVLTAAVILFANYLIRVLRILKLNQLNSILTTDCDPVKYETVFRTIRDGGWKSPNYTLNIARARYYQGDWQGAVAELKKMPTPKEKSILILQYYNLLASCLEMEGDFSRIIEIREKVKKIITGVKEKSNMAANGRQLLTIIDGILTFHRQNVTRAREIYEELFDNASFTLSRLTSLWKLAQLDQLTGAGRSAIDRCEYIIDAGGTTFYVAEAERILSLCRKPSPRLEESEEKEEADGAE
jgi:hypothetical protein